MLMPHIREFHSLFWHDAGTGEFLLFELPDYFWGFVTQYIRTKKKLAKVGNSLIG